MEISLNQAKKQAADENLFFSDSLKRLISDLPQRSQEIIYNRYGIFGSSAMTLEKIGKKYHITRERVRQVIREVFKKVKEKKNDQVFSQIQEKITLALRSNSGIMEMKQLLSALGKGNASEEASVRFFLECIDEIIANEIKEELKFSYALGDFDIEKWKTVKEKTMAVLKKHKKPLTFEELHELMQAEIAQMGLSKENLKHHLEVSEEVKKNAFDKWGIAEWKEISPKGTREKAYLILKEHGKPLHFREIASKIDESRLNKKKTHPQTIHNELIKDRSFVLVGRGIYALVEWGYKKGTVKDVIEEILKGSTQPLSREEILEKVLEARHVKKSTIIINLNNYFSKEKNGTYSLKR